MAVLSVGEGRKVAKKSCSVGLRVYSMGWEPGKALACGRDALRGREPGGRRKTFSAAEAGRLELLPARPELQKRAGSSRPRWPRPPGWGRAGGRGAGGGGAERA